MSRKHIATVANRELVAKAAGFGLREMDIAALLNISDKTLSGEDTDDQRKVP